MIADLAPAQLFRDEGLGDPRPGAARRGVLASGGAHYVKILRAGWGPFAFVDHLRARARARIEATFIPEAAPMARALVLGESDLEEADNQAFRASGLAHLLAVSGTHLVLVVVGAVRALIALLTRFERLSSRWDVGRIGAAAGIAISWIYADFAGGSGSANRAAAMLSFALGARALGRRPDGPRALGLSLLGASLIDPLVAFDLSFLLSVAATAGLMVLQRPNPRVLGGQVAGDAGAPKRVRLRALGRAGHDARGDLGCAPLISFISPSLPVGGVVANLLAVPVGELVALPLCLGHALLEFTPLAERGAAVVASGALLVVRAIARATEHASWLMLPVPRPLPWQCAILGTAALGVARAHRGAKWPAALVGLAVLALSEFVAIRQGAPRGKLRVTVLDVGQGDSSIIDFPDGRAMLVDAGGLVGSPIDTGQAVVAPMFRVRRRKENRCRRALSPSPRPFRGLAAALASVSVGEFWDTGQGESEGAGPVYAALLAQLRARGVTIVRPDSLCERPRSFGGATVEILGPCPGPVPFGSANDNSLVLRIPLGARAALLVGDAERAAEHSLLLPGRPSVRADFLKVGHHGSATSSSPEFIRAVAPGDAAISCGVRNRFGHPRHYPANPERCTRVHRTDREGSVRWETDGNQVSIAAGGAIW